MPHHRDIKDLSQIFLTKTVINTTLYIFSQTKFEGGGFLIKQKTPPHLLSHTSTVPPLNSYHKLEENIVSDREKRMACLSYKANSDDAIVTYFGIVLLVNIC